MRIVGDGVSPKPEFPLTLASVDRLCIVIGEKSGMLSNFPKFTIYNNAIQLFSIVNRLPQKR